jgi:hypothetical protein
MKVLLVKRAEALRWSGYCRLLPLWGGCLSVLRVGPAAVVKNGVTRPHALEEEHADVNKPSDRR